MFTLTSVETAPSQLRDPVRAVYFGIPLKARATARNWTTTVRDFNRTLASIYNQSNANFRIMVGCHDLPELLIATDERLEFIQVRSEPPDLDRDGDAIFPDRDKKLRQVGRRVRELGGRWFMALDADDLVSARLVEFVLTHPNPNGYIARAGYILDQETRSIAPLPHPGVFAKPFDQICGSCVLAPLEEAKAEPVRTHGQAMSRHERHLGLGHHGKLWQASIDEGRPLTPLPFPAAVYMVNTGDNHSFRHGPSREWRSRRLIAALRARSIPMDPGIEREFALDHELWRPAPGARPKIEESGFRIDFIGCGAMKAGTTSLAAYLRLHPAIRLGDRKELHYFDQDENFPPAGPDYGRYHAHFQASAGGSIYGEVTPVYMYLTRAMERIHAYNPDIKLLSILRNPVERAFSHWRMSVRKGVENLPFHEALKREAERHRRTAPRRTLPFGYMDRGFYTEQIRHVWRLFPPDQTLFVKSEELRDNPRDTLSRVFEFLGVEPMRIDRALSRNSGEHDDEPTAEERAFLVAVFEHEIRALERMLGWNCASWLA